MKSHHLVLVTSVITVICASATGAQQPPLTNVVSQTPLSGDAAAVWEVIDEEWGRSGCCGRENLMPNSKYLDLLTDDAVVWFTNAPHPVTKESMKKSDATIAENKPAEPRRIGYELYPQGLVIHANTAIAHYTCTVTVVTKDNTVNHNACRSTDILVRDRPGAPWRLISWVT